MAGLEIQIGADKTDFDKKVKEVEFDIKELSKLKLERIKLGLDTKELDKNIIDAKKSLSSLKTSLKDTGNVIGKDFTQKAGNGSNALMQFSRIAQDAPFGIMGIGNNITATVESFGHLTQSTGSAGGALKAMASSILGTGGILLAVSLVTSGLTYMSQQGITVGDIFSKLAGTFDANAQSLNKMNAEAAKSAAGGISEMNAYVATAKNVNLSMEDRLIAVKKLQDEYPAYFGNLSKEQILNGNVAGAVKEVTAALIAKARAAAYTGRITELALTEFNLRTKEEQILKDIAKQHNEIAIAKASANGVGGNASNMAIGAANDVLMRQQSLLKDTQNELRANWQERDKLTQKINENVAASIRLEAVAPKAGKKTYSTPQVIGVKSELDSAGLAETAGTIMQIAKNVQGAEGMISTSMGNIKQSFNMSGVAISENLKKFNGELSSIITNGTVSALSGIGEAIGDALVNGGNIIDSIGKTILGSMGSMLKDLGKATIAYGVGLIAVKEAIKNPYLAVAAGVAMVALGSAMSSAVSKSSSSALGGSSSGSGMSSGASYSSPASSSSYSSGGGGMGGGTVVFEISGTSLIGVLNNTLDRNKRLGGV